MEYSLSDISLTEYLPKFVIMNDKLSHIFEESLKLLLSAGADEEDARDYLHELITSVPEFVGKFYPGVLRWTTDGEINVEDDAELRQLNLFLKFIINTEAGEFYNSDFDSKSYAELVEFFHLDLTAEDYTVPEGAQYSHILIPSFEALQKFKEWTDDWCITLSDIAFDEYSEGGKKKIYLLMRDDYRDVPKKPSEGFPNDAYGESILCVIVNPDGSIDSVTNRWNAIGEEVSFHLPILKK